MNLFNVANHLLNLTQTECESENSATSTEEIFLAEWLFEVPKSFKGSYFCELYNYDSLDFDNECDEMTEDEESDNDKVDYDENEHSDIKDHFTLEEMENIIECVDEHPNTKSATISSRFKKVKYM
ncbi:unnamed protein product [Rotaria magnacalcarata]|uniref:Uncharacterized protein n=1 Tax=Rotaria magnacalcarata TaxID=392030 RepID=A0A816XJW0_9BILA|nr:unnamed protein product [Rotaria magnacalcarata]CAF2147861.1 unnamed protein product [Rotaria magnacalcarata]CAF4176631.1 unnamed protein product [Rotaria magnacalcarata]CAF4372572.1 unnamed protein product [Rotaria magnacalcarata]